MSVIASFQSCAISRIDELHDAGWFHMPCGLPAPILADLPMDSAVDQHAAGSRKLLGFTWCRALVEPIRKALVAAGTLSDDDRAVQCTLFRKTADCNWKVPYHQDLSIPVAENIAHPALSAWSVKEDGYYVQPDEELLSRMLVVRAHIDACTSTDGALRVIPGSHLHGRLTSKRIAAIRMERNEVECIAQVGDMIVMRPLLLHASSKALRPNGRRVLQFLFGPQQPGFGLQWSSAI